MSILTENLNTVHGFFQILITVRFRRRKEQKRAIKKMKKTVLLKKNCVMSSFRSSWARKKGVCDVCRSVYTKDAV